jgi:hypothetical protein
MMTRIENIAIKIVTFKVHIEEIFNIASPCQPVCANKRPSEAIQGGTWPSRFVSSPLPACAAKHQINYFQFTSRPFALEKQFPRDFLRQFKARAQSFMKYSRDVLKLIDRSR